METGKSKLATNKDPARSKSAEVNPAAPLPPKNRLGATTRIVLRDGSECFFGSLYGEMVIVGRDERVRFLGNR